MFSYDLVREELKGREAHYRDKKRRHTLAEDHLSTLPAESLYAHYWRAREAKQKIRYFDDYDTH